MALARIPHYSAVGLSLISLETLLPGVASEVVPLKAVGIGIGSKLTQILIATVFCVGLTVVTTRPVLACEVLVRDHLLTCADHPIPKDDNLAFNGNNNEVLTADGFDEQDIPTAVLQLGVEHGWRVVNASISPDRHKMLLTMIKTTCPTWSGVPDPAGLICNYGRRTKWLGLRNPNVEWLLFNLSLDSDLGHNLAVHISATWLHNNLVLFAAARFPENGAPGNTTSDLNIHMLSVSQTEEFGFDVAPYASEKAWNDQCLTVRLSSQTAAGGSCFQGQELAVTRRCEDEPLGDEGWSWYNTFQPDQPPEPDGSNWCLAGLSPYRVPKFRGYVVELEEDCSPMTFSSEWVPAREPPSDIVHKQMGIGHEWGDGQGALSPAGDYLAVVSLQGDPSAEPQPDCAGFLLNPTRDDPLSGTAIRWTHVCALGQANTCSSDMWVAPTIHMPPENTPWPFFLLEPSTGQLALFHSRKSGRINSDGLLESSLQWVRYDGFTDGTPSVTVLSYDHGDLLTPIASPLKDVVPVELQWFSID